MIVRPGFRIRVKVSDYVSVVHPPPPVMAGRAGGFIGSLCSYGRLAANYSGN